VAFDGTNYLVVWYGPSGGAYAVYGTRVSKAGAVLDPGFLTISSGQGNRYEAEVAFDGTNYLVVWTDHRSGLAQDIFGARVTRAGTVLDPNGIPISTDQNTQYLPKLAFDGTNYLVVWQDYQLGSRLSARRVSPAGAVLDASAITIAQGAQSREAASVTYNGSDLLVVWHDRRSTTSYDIYGGRVTSAGVPRDGDGFVISAGAHNELSPAVASSGGGHALVVYQAQDPLLGHNTQRLRARRLNPNNNPPTANAGSATTPEDVPAAVVLSGSDPDNDALTYAIATAPAHGTLTGTAPNLTYTPAPHYHGPDSFTFTVSDGTASSAPATVSLTVTPVSDAPVANAQSVEAQEDSPTALTLTGSDGDGDPLSFTVASGPSHGTLTGTAPSLTYTPAQDYHGPDSFTFTVSDGQSTSTAATVSITVKPGNDTPTALPRSHTTNEDTALPLVLSGLDPDGDLLAFAVASPPAHGTLSGTAPNLTYTPMQDYHGPDSFTFTVSDGQATSAPATVSIAVIARNDAPVATARSLTLSEDTLAALTLSGSDVDGDPLTFAIASPPARGTLSGTAPNLTYTPAADYHGPDSFTFTVSDGQATSAPATVSITISPRNDAPVATARSLTLDEDTPTAVTLAGSDAEGDNLSFTVASSPAHGTLTGTAPHLIYRPAPDYHGPDSFTFTASDGQATSALATVSITVVPRQDAPVARPLTLSTEEDTPVLVTLSGTDADADTLSFTVASGPSHGTLTGTAPDLTYTPAPGYHGPDSFTFTVSDGQATSAPATVSLTVTPSNDAPVAIPQALTTLEDTAATLTLSGSDEEGSSLTFTVTSPPRHGSLTGSVPHLTYMPAADYHGPDSFTFTVSDGRATSAAATVSITVSPRNDAPVATALSVTLDEDTPTALTLSGSDQDGDTLTFAITSQPLHGTLSGTAPSLTYTPAPGYQGPDSFTFTASDGQATSAPATVSLSIVPGNDAPVAEPQALTVPAGHPVHISLSGSDEDGDELTFSIVASPNVGKLTGTPPDVVYTAPPSFRGSARFTFSVNDGTTSSQADVQLTVVKKSLMVSAAVDSRRPAERQPVRFYANAVDEAGAPISLTWDFGDGKTSHEELPVHAFAAPGTYNVRLKATTATEEATASLRLWVRSFAPITVTPNAPSAPALIGEEGSSLTFRVDAAPPTLSYSWDFGDGTPPTTGATASHEWEDNGRFTLKVTASDGSGTRWVATRSIIILNAPPVPLPQAPLTARVGEPVTLQLAGSDAAGAKDPLQWELISGEGTLSLEGMFRWTPSQAGLATVITTVHDGDGGEAPLAFQLSVDSPPIVEPEPSTGCGCGASSGDASGALGLGVLLALLALSRRVFG
jgi:MYXO-CTERM domain-containing protein